ncbi:hypothetical protein BCF46_1153 [Litoreibacter meonggei]|uniref:Uncharacterized protein n=1 Tax=Litoreibacter meonggei TaxID=1049199 RepID=A0A497WQE0_9RHOB|nr:hypothetical protein [Litoreibacter meonggei]RLJ59011.1 hypothetical protein BCF46_1153 [Litoreibacter meonggei]
MKTIIAAAIALTVSAPAFADVSNAQAFFALGNDSAAERTVGETSTGNIFQSQLAGAKANDSVAESTVDVSAGQATRTSTDLLSFFALGNDSAAERVNY